MRLFLDGVMLVKDTGYAAINVGNSAADLVLGGNNAGANDRWRGYLDEVRITKGVGRYDSDAAFEAPTTPYPKS
jgi:hypothetical protein